MKSLEELLDAPLLPKNLPPFEIIKECEKVVESDYESGSETESSDEEIEEVFPCECRYEEQSTNFEGQACGPSANCINRELFIECNGEECPCRNHCQNRRFQNREYASVKVIETPGKGFGLFVCEDLRPGSLIMEYVGEVVTREQMGKRAELYAKQKQPHFYFMTLRPDQIIDATCKGNLSRFLNHSCAPNCQTQKWIVGGRIKIGLFSLKSIKAGSELTFDYKFVRFGKEPQKCLCGEPNCTGFIGVSSEDSSTNAQNRSNRKKKQQENDEDEDEIDEEVDEDEIDEEVDDFNVFMESDPKSAELPGQVSLIVKKLIQTDDLSIIKKLLKILAATEKYLCQRKFLNLHGLKLLSTLFTEHSKDDELVSTILNILVKLPISKRNFISDSGWFSQLRSIKDSPADYNQDIQNIASILSEKWSNLEEISKVQKKSDVNSQNNSVDTSSVLMSVPTEFSSALNRKRFQYQSSEDKPTRSYDREGGSRDRDRSGSDNSRSRSPVKKMIPDPMWLSAHAPDGKVYYYHSVSKETRWDVPMIPQDAAPSRVDQRDERHYHNSRSDHYNRDGRSDHYNRDSGHYREQREFRDYRDKRDGRNYRENRDNEPIRSESNVKQSTSFLEGIEDSSQLAAIIERAKLRRGGNAEDETEESRDILKSPVSSPDRHSPGDEKRRQHRNRLKEEISGVVIRFLSFYKTDLGDDFKSLARKYSHKIIDKELKESSVPVTVPGQSILTVKKKLKIKNYLAEILKARGIKLISEHEAILKN